MTLNLTGQQLLNFNIHIGGIILAVILCNVYPAIGIKGATAALVLTLMIRRSGLVNYCLKKRLGLHSQPTVTQAFQRRAEVKR